MIFKISEKLSLLTFLKNSFLFISLIIKSFLTSLFFQIKSATSFSILSFHITNQPKIQSNIHDVTYIKVTFHQNNHINKATATSFIRGEVIRKVKVIPSGIHAFKKPTNIGILEQLQNGVIAQNQADKK
ncbi:MAG: hypothetical protein ACD_4C00338G0003 [uncultured bacterium (gcode 4)]|uniref:Uncharacterized protein n=1 Tax=uncultured bacterium (gcode 4) TaxID=1234023 RepID=K2FWP7_9BACT|nr:MAG: hypothetical protein ACD_4C00338G0003 [uncultured bacterium (gcode 4)]